MVTTFDVYFEFFFHLILFHCPVDADFGSLYLIWEILFFLNFFETSTYQNLVPTDKREMVEEIKLKSFSNLSNPIEF